MKARSIRNQSPNLTSFVLIYKTRSVSDFPLLCFKEYSLEGIPGKLDFPSSIINTRTENPFVPMVDPRHLTYEHLY